MRVVILLPLPSFLEDSTSIWNPVIKDKIIPKLQNIAYKTNVEIIDLYQLFVDRSDLLPDKIHPSSLGATVIANRLYENIIRDRTVALNITDNKLVTSKKESNFYGFRLTDFKFNDWELQNCGTQNSCSGKFHG